MVEWTRCLCSVRCRPLGPLESPITTQVSCVLQRALVFAVIHPAGVSTEGFSWLQVTTLDLVRHNGPVLSRSWVLGKHVTEFVRQSVGPFFCFQIFLNLFSLWFKSRVFDFLKFGLFILFFSPKSLTSCKYKKVLLLSACSLFVRLC